MKAEESGIIQKQIKVVMADEPEHIQAGLLSISGMKECLQAIWVLFQSIGASAQVDMMDMFMRTRDEDFLPRA